MMPEVSPNSRAEKDLLGITGSPGRRILRDPNTPGFGELPYLRSASIALSGADRGTRNDQDGGCAGEPGLRPTQPEIADAIEAACAELIDGRLHDQFQLDVFRAARAPPPT